MALDVFVAGRYSGAYNSLDVGITRDGFELTIDTELEDIGETDAWGRTVLDALFQGANCFVQFVSTAWKSGSLAAFYPWGGALGGAGVLGVLYDSTQTAKAPIATLASAAALPLVLTSTAGTPAAQTGPIANTLTASYALLAKNNNSRLLFNSKLREVPVRLRLYPYSSGGITRWFSYT